MSVPGSTQHPSDSNPSMNENDGRPPFFYASEHTTHSGPILPLTDCRSWHDAQSRNRSRAFVRSYVRQRASHIGNAVRRELDQHVKARAVDKVGFDAVSVFA